MMLKKIGVIAVTVVALSLTPAVALTRTTNINIGDTRIVHCRNNGQSVVSKTSANNGQVSCVAPSTTTTTRPATTTTVSPTTTTVAPTTTTAAPTTTTVAPTTTTVAPTTTTVAPTTTTLPSGGGFPTAASTGVPAGTALTNSGSITVTTPGTVIDAKDITGTVLVRANNVTVQRSKITVSAGPWTVGVMVDPGFTGTRVLDTTIVAPNGFTGIVGTGGFLAQRVNIQGFENGIEIRGGSGTILDSYVFLKDFRYPDGTIPHFDAVTSGSANGVVVRHNTLTAPPDQTAAVNFTNDFGSITNVTIDNNLLTGGGYALYLRGDPGGPGRPVSGISVTNNRFGKSQWGYASVVQAQVTYSANVDNATGQPIF